MTLYIPATWPFGKGSMADLVRNHDWFGTGLGPIERWPQSLKTVVDLLLASGLPMAALWGPDLVQIYNDRFRDLMGNRHPCSLGQPSRECWPEVWCLDRPIYERILAGETLQLDARFVPILRDGNPQDASFAMYCSPLRNDSGKVEGVLVTAVETTSLHVIEASRREKPLQSSEQFVRRVLDNLFVFVGVLTPDGTLIEVNRAPLEAAGIAAADVIGRKFWDCYWWSHASEPQSQLREAIERANRGETVRYDVPVRMAGDSRMWIDFQLAPLRDDTGRITHLIPSAMDLTARRTAEETLRESEEKARLALSAAHLGIWKHDLDSGTFELDALARGHYGVARSTLSFDEFVACIHPDDRPMLQAAVSAALDPAIRGPVAIEYRVLDEQAGVRWLSIFGAVHFAGDGDRVRPVRAVGTTQDISARKQAEERLKRSESFHRFVLELSQATQDRIESTDILRTAARMLGRELDVDRCYYSLIDEEGGHADIVGTWLRDESVERLPIRFRRGDFAPERFRSLYAGKPFVVDDIEQDDRVAVERAMYRAAGAIANLSVGLLRDGRLVAVLGVHQRTPRRWSEPEIQLVQEVASRSWETLNRARSQRELLESERRFRELADSQPQIIYVADADGRINFVNRQWREYTGKDGVHISELLEATHPDDLEELIRLWKESVRAEIPVVGEYRLRSAADDAYRWFLTRAVPVRDEQGNTVRWYGTSMEIDEQKRHVEALQRAHDALQEADRRKDEYLAMLSHELRGPLTPVRNMLALLEREPLSARGQQVLAMGERQVRHLARLINDLLEVSRVTRGLIELRCEPILVQHVITAAADTVASSLAERSQRLRFRMPDEPLQIVADPVRLAQIIENLLTNASKYSEADGDIRIGVRREADQVIIEVEDDGIGVAPENLPRLFDLFVQVDTSIDRSRGGWGSGWPSSSAWSNFTVVA